VNRTTSGESVLQPPKDFKGYSRRASDAGLSIGTGQLLLEKTDSGLPVEVSGAKKGAGRPSSITNIADTSNVVRLEPVKPRGLSGQSLLPIASPAPKAGITMCKTGERHVETQAVMWKLPPESGPSYQVTSRWPHQLACSRFGRRARGVEDLPSRAAVSRLWSLRWRRRLTRKRQGWLSRVSNTACEEPNTNETRHLATIQPEA
jgi:hypothetical protein